MATLYTLHYIKEEEFNHLLVIFQLFINNKMSTIYMWHFLNGWNETYINHYVVIHYYYVQFK
jgi:hypothetical protein